MNFLPKSSGARPRVACEISCQGVVAARSADQAGALSAVAKADLPLGAVVPSLKPGNIVDRLAVTTALRRVMEGIGAKGNSRGSDITLVIPDTAVRVLLLEFDALSNKLSEALPIVRFRLKRLLPFDADDAMVTFQIMSSTRNLVRVLAVAIPRDVLADYETAAREAGFEPGAVLPSTLATLPSSDTVDEAVLIVNANRLGVTTAIVRSGVLLLHRSVDLQDHAAPTPPNVPAEMFEPTVPASLSLIDREASAAEWAAQEPLPEHGRSPYADRARLEEAVQNEDAITHLPVPPVFAASEAPPSAVLSDTVQPAFVPASPAASAEEIAQAISVAAAYYEDTLSTPPTKIFSAGPLGANEIRKVLLDQGIAADGLTIRELVESSALLSEAVSASVPRSWLAAVAGALRG